MIDLHFFENLNKNADEKKAEAWCRLDHVQVIVESAIKDLDNEKDPDVETLRVAAASLTKAIEMLSTAKGINIVTFGFDEDGK